MALEVNCDCDIENTEPVATLATLRTRLMRRLGYSAQATNPPPGMAALLNDYLYSAQVLLFEKKPAIWTERFYTWTMTPQLRFYSLANNDEQEDCPRVLDPYKVSWVGIEDLNGQWYELHKGIDPISYTQRDDQPGYPARYEIRSCIEVWPAPQSAFKLRIKGHFGLEPFAADADETTIHPELVFLLALGNAKADKGHRDATSVLTQLDNFLKDRKAGTHQTARYIPQTRPLAPLTRPRFLPLG